MKSKPSSNFIPKSKTYWSQKIPQNKALMSLMAGGVKVKGKVMK